MSDDNPQSAPPSVDELIEGFRNYEARAAELHPANKASLFAALRNAGIASVTVNFDGYGDSGQIEDITAVSADQSECEIPATIVELQLLSFGENEPICVSQPLQEAVETLSYALLGSVHCGWENNEGAFGDFTFDVAAGTISLDYNERFASSENYTHEF